MLSLVVLLSSVAATLAVKCCAPPQFEGRIGFITAVIHNGKVQTSSGGAEMAYDGLNHIVGHRESVTLGNSGKTTNVDVLMDYNSNTKYIRQGTNCVKTRLNRNWVDPCIPDNATVIGTSDVLGLSSNSLAMDTYLINFGGVVDLYLSVTSDGCLPVLESFRGELGQDRFMENTGYVNVSLGLSPETVAALRVPPQYCENAPLVSAHYTQGNFPAGQVGRRSLFGL